MYDYFVLLTLSRKHIELLQADPRQDADRGRVFYFSICPVERVQHQEQDIGCRGFVLASKSGAKLRFDKQAYSIKTDRGISERAPHRPTYLPCPKHYYDGGKSLKK